MLEPDRETFVRTPHHQGDSSAIEPTDRWHRNEQSFQYVDTETPWGQTYPQYTPHK